MCSFVSSDDVGAAPTPSCPLCGARTVPIVYGNVGGELFALDYHEKLKIGGCLHFGDNPVWYCVVCRYELPLCYGAFTDTSPEPPAWHQAIRDAVNSFAELHPVDENVLTGLRFVRAAWVSDRYGVTHYEITRRGGKVSDRVLHEGSWAEDRPLKDDRFPALLAFLLALEAHEIPPPLGNWWSTLRVERAADALQITLFDAERDFRFTLRDVYEK